MHVLEKIDGVAKILGMSPSLVKKYYLLFEEKGYKFKRSNEGHLLFDNHDIDLFKELIQLKNEPGMTVKKAVEEIVRQEVITDMEVITDITSDKAAPSMGITVMTKQVTEVMTAIEVMSKQFTTVMTDMTELKEQNKELNDQVNRLQEFIKNQLNESLKEVAVSQVQAEDIIKQLPQPKTREEERQERTTDMITRQRIMYQLRKEALNLWSAKPESERTMKVGFFRKVEDHSKKEQFIDDYINEHFEERVKQEYEIE